MMKIREIKFYAYEALAPRMIEDGWRPLSVRPGPTPPEIVLSVLVEEGRTEESEVFEIRHAGVPFSSPEGKELAYIGDCQEGRHLFLQLPQETGEPVRRIGRPEW